MKQHSIEGSAPAAGRRIAGRAQDDHVDDPYQARQKPKEPTLCPQCGAVFHDGRWCWISAPGEAGKDLCPACRRINDKYPAGILTLTGAFVGSHKAEILQLARNQEEQEKQEHPMNRIASVVERPDRIEIATTDIHSPRRIGEALRRAYHGALAIHYERERYFVRVEWRRED